MSNKNLANKDNNPLGTEPVGKLIRKFAVPSVISMLVMSLYNIVDQIFIGNAVGELGNAATNVAFPFTTLCIATALTFGIGASSGFNLNMGAGNKEKAPLFVGNGVFFMVAVGLILSAISFILLEPMLILFGATKNILPYAMNYMTVIAIGFPACIFSAGGAHLVRADGSPKFSMACNLSGALANVVLDYLFVIVFDWKMEGAAAATIIGQYISAIMVIYYLFNFKTIKLKLSHFKPNKKICLKTMHLGMAQGLNQISIMLVQIVMNNSLKYYGGFSVYGSDTPLAVTGIAMKVNQIYFSFCIGVSQGMQPIASFNRGAKKFDRLKQTYKLAITITTVISVIAFIMFQIFPRNIISIFGEGNSFYYDYAVRFFRIFLFMTFLDGIQPITSTFCTAIGQPNKGTLLSLTRQVLFFVPLALTLPLIFRTVLGQANAIYGLMYVGPIADCLAAIVSIFMIRNVFKNLK